MKSRKDNSYISKILFEGFCDNQLMTWELTSGVNILSGSNGSGKSTLVEALALLLRNDMAHHIKTKPYERLVVEFSDGRSYSSDDSRERLFEDVDIVATFDTPLKGAEAIKRLSNDLVCTDLDWELHKVLALYVKYQLSIGNKAIKLLLGGGGKESIDVIMEGKNRYLDIIDEMFSYSGKVVVRDSDELRFATKNSEVSPFQLSSGEKQLLIILTTVLVQDGVPSVLIMDEPELSLHHQWQKKLLERIVSLNANLQIITTTHSPAMIMDGWLDKVTDITDISHDRE